MGGEGVSIQTTQYIYIENYWLLALQISIYIHQVKFDVTVHCITAK